MHCSYAPTKVPTPNRDRPGAKMTILSPSVASEVAEELPFPGEGSAIFNPDSVSLQFNSVSDPKASFDPDYVTKNEKMCVA